MIPNKKASELISRFKMLLMDEDTDCGNEILVSIIAKKAALIAVDEIIDDLNNSMTAVYELKNLRIEGLIYGSISYWFSVKNAIKKQ